MDNLNLTARSSGGLIHVGGTVTHIAHALGLTTKIYHLTAYCSHTLIDLNHCLERNLIRRLFFSPDNYKLLIDDETIHYFGLSNPTRTSVDNKENWSYPLEAQDETPNSPKPHRFLNTILHPSWKGPKSTPLMFICTDATFIPSLILCARRWFLSANTL